MTIHTYIHIYSLSGAITCSDFPLVWRDGSHVIYSARIVRHIAGCTAVTYPNITSLVYRLYCERAGQVVNRECGISSTRGNAAARSRHSNRKSPSETFGQNTTRRLRIAWGRKLDYYSPVGHEVPGRVRGYRRSMRGRRRGHTP